jgi:prepilin-type N-terminal cleavage/methylation domain-containing protein
MSRRKGFTLVELLVVVIVIAMLAGLLLPAVVRGREAARRAECLNNQGQLVKAMQQFENARGQLPGYINKFGGVSNLSWIVMLLPYVGEQELWKQWRDPNTTLAQKYQSARVPLSVVKCPSNTAIPPLGLSFVVNCGRADLPNDVKPGATGLFFDHTVANPVVVRTEAIPDGADNTIMMSENLQATSWAPPVDGSGNWAPSTREKVAHVGMLWLGDTQSSRFSPCWQVNQCRDAMQNELSPRLDLARPSSNHPGGVNVSYASGRQQFMDEGIDYTVFRQLMAPDDARAAGSSP